MKRLERLDPIFVERMPAVLEPGKLYVSIEYALVAHLCPSGCGEKVVLPLHPAQWRFTYDGQTISMHPSIGNVGMACNSHYWIRCGQVDWAEDISLEVARAGQLRDRGDLARHSTAEAQT